MKYLVYCLVLLAGIFGCSPSEEVPTSPVVFTYSGGCYTEAQLDEDVKLREFMFREAVRNRQGDLARIDADLPQLRKMWREDAIVKGVLMTSVRLQAERERLCPTAAQRTEVETRYAATAGNKAVDFGTLRERATEAGVRAAFDNQFERDVTFSALGEAIVHGDTGFNETNVWIFLSNASNDLRQCEAKNVELYQLATNAVKRLRAGEDFNKVYDECCNLEPYEKDETRAPAEYDLSDFPDEDGKEVWEALKALPDGGVSEVLETDEGLVIYKVFEHIAKSAQTEQFALKLGKLVVRRVVVMAIPTPDEARKDVKRWFAKEAFERKMKAAVEASQIDFGPAATNLSRRLQKQLTEMGVFKKAEEKNDASK